MNWNNALVQKRFKNLFHSIFKYRKSPFSDPGVIPICVIKTVYFVQFKMRLMKRENFRLYDDVFNLMTKIKTFWDIKDTIAFYLWARKRWYAVWIFLYSNYFKILIKILNYLILKKANKELQKFLKKIEFNAKLNKNIALILNKFNMMMVALSIEASTI